MHFLTSKILSNTMSPRGVEPRSAGPKPDILSVKLRALNKTNNLRLKNLCLSQNPQFYSTLKCGFYNDFEIPKKIYSVFTISKYFGFFLGFGETGENSIFKLKLNLDGVFFLSPQILNIN